MENQKSNFFKNKTSLLIFVFSLVLGNIFVAQDLVLAEEAELLHLVVLADISGSLNTDDTENLQRLIQKGNIDKDSAIKIADNPEIFEKGIF